MAVSTRTGARRRRLVGSGPTHYVYRDEAGDPLFRVGRTGDKRFFQNAYLGNENWAPGLTVTNGDGEPHQVRSVLYNLPQVTAVADRGGNVWMVEGEKDADRLNSLLDEEGEHRVTATTTPGGAGNFDPDILAALYGVRKLIICYDRDEKGEQHARALMRACKRHGIQYVFAHIPDKWKCNDITDALDAGYELSDLVRTATPPGSDEATESEDTSANTSGKFDLTQQPPVFQLALERANTIAAERGRRKARFKHRKYEQTGKIEFEVSCPAHDDRRASFAIMVGDDQPLLVNCKAGCEQDAIADALGIRLADFSEYHPPDAEDAEVEREAHKIRVRRRAQMLVSSEDAVPLELPEGHPGEYMTAPLPKHLFTIDDLHVRGANTLIVAQYKTGKTTVCINLLRSIVNREPFLGRFSVDAPDGKLCYLDYEMQAHQFREWLRAGGPLDLDRMTTPLHLRGIKFPFWLEDRRKQFTQWLVDNEVTTLVVDTGMRASDGLVDNWNDNNQMMAFTAALDTLKFDTDIDDLFVVTHTGRDARFAEEGQEHARGATRLEDWMDAGWYYTKDDTGTRYLRAMGRGVDVEPFAIEFEANTHKLMTTGVGKSEHQAQRALETLVDTMFSVGGDVTPAEIKSILEKAKAKQSVVGEAIQRGLIDSIVTDRRTTYKLTDVGVNLHHRKVTAS